MGKSRIAAKGDSLPHFFFISMRRGSCGLHKKTASYTTILMKQKMMGMPELILIAGTRVALGAGIGLLIGNKLDRNQRTAAGFALFAVGVLSTIPLMIEVFSKKTIDDEPDFLPDIADTVDDALRSPITA